MHFASASGFKLMVFVPFNSLCVIFGRDSDSDVDGATGGEVDFPIIFFGTESMSMDGSRVNMVIWLVNGGAIPVERCMYVELLVVIAS